LGNLRAAVLAITKLPIYQIDEELGRKISAGILWNNERGNNEGQGISEEDLRQVQDRSP
jgi:hypothetical protein